jgi:3'-5' exoribonuclease
MLVEEILKLPNNTIVEGTFLLNDPKLRPFSEKDGHFFTFNLQDKTGTIWAKIWDNAEHIAHQLKEQDIQIITIKGRTNLYNNKIQIIVDKIKKAESYNIQDLIKMSSNTPSSMLNELKSILSTLTNPDLIKIYNYYLNSSEFLNKFTLWPGGKGTVHHAYQHGLLEHTLSVTKTVKSFQSQLNLPINIETAIIGALTHDLGKIDAYEFEIKTNMSTIGRLHEHTALGYYNFRKTTDSLDLLNKSQLTEEIGHIILSHHGTYEHHSIIKPMTLEAKLVAFADYLDSETNYMTQQLIHNSDEQGWIFDTLNNQFYFKRPQQQTKKEN